MSFFANAKSRLFLVLIAFCGLTVAADNVSAALSRNQARDLIRRAAGFELTGGAVRVRSVSDTSSTSAEIRADVRTVFKFQKHGNGNWRVAEIRTGQDAWEQIDIIAIAMGHITDPDECANPDPPFRGSLAIDPSNRRARCLLGNLFGIAVPSDAVRIQEVSPLAVPLALQPSATVTAWISIDARAVREQGKWRITELRTGTRNWTSVDTLLAAVNQRKQGRARAELEAMVSALENYRRDRGTYIVSESQAVLIDHISPNYLLPVVRIDPWNRPYQYQGTSNSFTLLSTGPDRKAKTSDDISLSRSAN